MTRSSSEHLTPEWLRKNADELRSSPPAPSPHLGASEIEELADYISDLEDERMSAEREVVRMSAERAVAVVRMSVEREVEALRLSSDAKDDVIAERDAEIEDLKQSIDDLERDRDDAVSESKRWRARVAASTASALQVAIAASKAGDA